MLSTTILMTTGEVSERLKGATCCGQDAMLVDVYLLDKGHLMLTPRRLVEIMKKCQFCSLKEKVKLMNRTLQQLTCQTRERIRSDRAISVCCVICFLWKPEGQTHANLWRYIKASSWMFKQVVAKGLVMEMRLFIALLYLYCCYAM